MIEIESSVESLNRTFAIVWINLKPNPGFCQNAAVPDHIGQKIGTSRIDTANTMIVKIVPTLTKSMNLYLPGV